MFDSSYCCGRKRRAEGDEAQTMEVSELPVENGPVPDGPTLGERLEALQLRMRQVRIINVLLWSLPSMSYCTLGLTRKSSLLHFLLLGGDC